MTNKILTQKELTKINGEIEYWARLQELDKFNYNYNAFFYLGAISALIAMLSLIWATQQGLFRFIIVDCIFLLILFLTIKTVLQNKRAKEHFDKIEDKIKEKYKKIGVDVTDY